MSDTTQLFFTTFGDTGAEDTVTDVSLGNGTIIGGSSVDGVGSTITTTPRSIDLVAQDGVYFVTGDNGEIYEEHAGQSASFGSAVVIGPAGGNLSIISTAADAADNTLYFIDGATLYAEQFSAGFGSPQSLTALADLNDFNGGTAGPTGELVYDQADHSAYFAGIQSSLSISFTHTTGAVSGNYIYKVSGLTSGATAADVSVSNALAGGGQVPLVDGLVEGMALDTATDTLYFTTNATPNLGSTPDAGIYAVALSGPDAGVIETIYSQAITDYTSPFAHFGTIAIDSQTGEYYISVVDGSTGEILVGNVNDAGAAPVLLESTNTTGAGEDGSATPLNVAVDGGPSLTGVSVLAIDGNGADTTGVISGADTVTLAVTLDGHVTVSGTPELSLNDGGTATYASGTGSDVLLFTYTPGPGENIATLGVTGLTGSVTDAFGAGFDGSIAVDFAGLGVATLPPTISAGGTVTLMAGGNVVLDSTLAITDPGGVPMQGATVAISGGFAAGDTLEFANQNGITGSYDSADGVLILTGSASAADYQAALESVGLSSSAPDPSFSGTDAQRTISYLVGDAAGESNAGSSTVVVVCYLHGTGILAAQGQVAVETLAAGDLVVTRGGGMRRVKWVGAQRFDARFVRNNREKLPVCIKAGALGGGLPLRDLFVSPGHSMLLGETLVLARNLVNGVTVTQGEIPDEVAYYQIELDGHDCVLAEGAWSESYADAPGLRAQFHNAAEFWALYPEYVTPDGVTTCRPRPQHGPALAAALAPVVAQAAAGRALGTLAGWVERIVDGRVEGWAVDLAQAELPVLLEVLCGAEMLGTVLACDPRGDLRTAGYGQGHCSFSFACPQRLEAAQVTVRRAADGFALPFTPELREVCRAA